MILENKHEKFITEMLQDISKFPNGPIRDFYFQKLAEAQFWGGQLRALATALQNNMPLESQSPSSKIHRLP